MEVPKAHSTEDVDNETHKLHASELREEACAESLVEDSNEQNPKDLAPIKDNRANLVPTRNLEPSSGSNSGSADRRSRLSKPTVSSALRASVSIPVTRRSSTGGLPEKQHPVSVSKRQSSDGISVSSNRTSSTKTDPLRKSLPEMRGINSIPSSGLTKPSLKQIPLEIRKSVPVSPVVRTPRTPTSSDSSKQDSSGKSLVRLPQALSASSVKVRTSPSLDSAGSGGGSIRKPAAKVSVSSAHSPTLSSGSKVGSLSTSFDRSSGLPSRKKVGTPESRDSRLIMLPKVEVKAGDNVRLDLRGHRIRTLNNGGLNLSPNLEFLYLRDNLLSTLEGIEVLQRVKVLDLSFNDFKGPGFEPLENCKALQQLYLAGNQITSLKSLPELPNLEFLSVAQNKLKSLSMASQPRLQVLAASKNKISTLKGFPYLPALEHLRLEENPILKMSHVEVAAILLIGPTLKKFNDRDLPREAIAMAKRYPSHAALCIRGGWDLCRPDAAPDSTFKFLLEQWKEQLPPGFSLKKASVDRPFEEDSCCCHFEFVKDKETDEGSVDSEIKLKYQWFVGSRSLSKFTAISGSTEENYFPKHDDISRILKVECTPVLGEVEYPAVFAISSPVSPGTGIPKVMKIDVRGDLVEGNTIKGYAEVAWCGGTPGKGVASWLRKKWNSSPAVIAGAEEEEYQLTLDDVDSCLVYMYTPVTEEGARGEPQYAITDHVKAAPPSVSGLQVTGDIIEGNTIRGLGKYFGGKEGPSTFEWLREDKDTGEFKLVLTGTSEYTLTKEDVGRRLKFVYTPVNFEGQEGVSMSVVSERVMKAPPKVTLLKIIGELKEGSQVKATGIVTGGTEASSRVQWFKSSIPTFEGEDSVEVLSTSKIAKAFRIPLGAVGQYLVAKFTPMTPDGEAGEPAYVISDTSVATLPPSLNFLSITGDNCEGGVLTASYGYIGGHEGKSSYNWYLHEVENDLGTPIPDVSGLEYHITKDAIGKFISFRCTPVRDDGIVGEPRTCTGQERVRPGSPRLLSLQVSGTAIEGSMLMVKTKYWGGEEGESVYRWFRAKSDGTHGEIVGATSSSYMLCADDIGYFVSVSCEPVRSDWARGPIVISEQVGPIVPGPPTCHSLDFHGSLVEGKQLGLIAKYTGGVKGDCLCEWFRVKDNGQKQKLHRGETLDLTLDEVGARLELVYTPVRADGTWGRPKTVVSDPVAPGGPLGIELVIPSCCEGQEVVPEKKYFGGREGIGKYIWFRTKDKLSDSSLMELASNIEDVNICGRDLTYTPSLEDVGSYLALYWLPTRSDGEQGLPLVSSCESPVVPAFPVVSKICMKKLSSSTYCGEGDYFGGYEGESLFSWYRESDDGNTILISGASSKTYEVSDEDYNCRLVFGYTPVRSDSVVGELQLSEPSDVVFPELPMIETLALNGKAVEGEVLTALEVIPQSEIQRHVWNMYKKEVRYQWFSSPDDGSERDFEPLPAQRSCSYRVRFEDIGHHLRCECIVTDVFERSSDPAYAETSSVLPGFPRMDKLEIEGRGFHTNLYAVSGVYSGGREGKSRIQWLRSMVGSPDLISIPGETGRMYEANVDDVGYRLVAIYAPVREDGTEGQPVSASTDPISVEPDVLTEVKQKLELGSVKFEVLCDKDRSQKKVPGMGSLERRILEVNRKRVKVVKPGSKTSFPATEIRGTYTPPFHVELFRNDQHRLRLVVDSENEVDLMVQTRHLRDVIVLVIRGLAQRFNSTSLNTLLKIDA